MGAEVIPTIRDLSGRWSMDKNLSTNLDQCMTLQKVSWLLQKAIGMANVTLVVHHEGERLDIDNVAAAQSFATRESRTLNWEPREIKMAIFGRIWGRSRIVTFTGDITVSDFTLVDEGVLEEADDLEWLGSEWIRDADGSVHLLESQGKNLDVGWMMHQMWGFQLINGEPRYVRKMVIWRNGKKARATTVYHWLGALLPSDKDE